MKNNKGFIDIESMLVLMIFIAIIVGVVWLTTIEYQNNQTTTCTVKDKWIKPSSESSKYLVNCGNEVYEITDLFFKGKFNSSDIYSKMKKGKKYTITTTGYRIRFFSMYKNVNKIEEVK